MSAPAETETTFGVLAEFAGADELLDAVRAARSRGWREMEAYTPLPLHEVSEALGYKSRLPQIVFAGGLTGALFGYGLQVWTAVSAYPMNIGGRPDISWPSFLVVTFECTILFAAFSAVLGMFALNGLPRPHHPVFAVPGFELASRNRFFLLLLARDPLFELDVARSFLEDRTDLPVEEVMA